MTRMHPQDLRAIVAALQLQAPEANAKTAVRLTDGLLSELERTAKPEPQPSDEFFRGVEHGRRTPINPAPTRTSSEVCEVCHGTGKVQVDVDHSWPCSACGEDGETGPAALYSARFELGRIRGILDPRNEHPNMTLEGLARKAADALESR